MKRTDTRAKFDTLIIGAEQDLRHRRRRTVAAGLIAAAAAVALIAVALSFGINRQDSTEPAQTPTPAEQVAAGFLNAYAAADDQLMATQLAAGAHLGDLRDSAGARWREAAGYRILNESCQQQATTTARIRVVCTFDYHMLGSDQLGRGPFTGDKLIVTVKDDKIVTAKEVDTFLTNGFSSQMWIPFSGFVVGEFPKDASIMYSDWPATDSPATTDRSIALWAEHSQDYVNEYQ